MKTLRTLLLFFLWISIAITTPLSAISQRGTWIGATFTGILTGIPALFLPNTWKLLSIPLGGLGFCLGRTVLYQFTPDKRIEQAEFELNKLAYHRLVNRFYTNEKQLFGIVEDVYITDNWPLIAAFNDLKSFMYMPVRARDLANRAQREDRRFSKRARMVIDQANIFENNLRESLKLIKASDNYFAQLNQFKEEQRHKEHIEIQRSLARAQWSNAQAQQKMAEAQETLATTAKKCVGGDQIHELSTSAGISVGSKADD